MLTFLQYLAESNGLNNAAALAISAKLASLNRQLQQNPKATPAEKILSNELLCIAGLIGLDMVRDKGK